MDKKKPIYDNVKLPKNWGKIRIGGKLVNPTVKEILTVQGEDNQDYKIKNICPDCNKKYVEEPKPECDHVIKISAGGSEFCELSKIHTSGKETDCGDSGYQGAVIYYPVCCPECGEKLNLKKDE